MASGANSTVGTNFLKKFYQPKHVLNTISKKSSRLLNLVTHNTNGAGKDYNFLSVVGDNPSGSATMTKAQATGTTQMQLGAQFVVPWFNDYENPTVAGDLIAKTRNDKGGWLPALRAEMDSSLRYAAHRKSHRAVHLGMGRDRKHRRHHEPGDQRLHARGHVGHLPVRQGDDHRVQRVAEREHAAQHGRHHGADRPVGQLQQRHVHHGGRRHLDPANLNTITGIAAGDIIFISGDRQDSATPSLLRPVGLGSPLGGGWAPLVAPTGGESFFGQDRTQNSFLYSFYTDARTMGIAQALVGSAQTASSIGNADSLVGVISPKQFTALAVSLQGQVQYTEIKGRAGVAFKTIMVYADGIELPVISDKYCVDAVGYVLDPKAVHWTSIGEAPQISDDDGQRMVRQVNDDGVEVRIKSYETCTLENAASCVTVQFA
jgi:hypothetical protein